MAQDLSQWSAYKPTDPAKQLAAIWHAYPNSDIVGDPQDSLLKFGAIAFGWTRSVIDAGYPMLISEFGDHNAAGTPTDDFGVYVKADYLCLATGSISCP